MQALGLAKAVHSFMKNQQPVTIQPKKNQFSSLN